MSSSPVRPSVVAILFGLITAVVVSYFALKPGAEEPNAIVSDVAVSEPGIAVSELGSSNAKSEILETNTADLPAPAKKIKQIASKDTLDSSGLESRLKSISDDVAIVQQQLNDNGVSLPELPNLQLEPVSLPQGHQTTLDRIAAIQAHLSQPK